MFQSSYFRIIANILSTSDLISRLQYLNRNNIENIPISDIVISNKKTLESINDTSIFSDELIKVLSYNIRENFTTTDIVSSQIYGIPIHYVSFINETLQTIDIISRILYANIKSFFEIIFCFDQNQ